MRLFVIPEHERESAAAQRVKEKCSAAHGEKKLRPKKYQPRAEQIILSGSFAAGFGWILVKAQNETLVVGERLLYAEGPCLIAHGVVELNFDGRFFFTPAEFVNVRVGKTLHSAGVKVEVGAGRGGVDKD